MIRRIAYVSRARTGMSFAEIPRIVAAGRTCNTHYGITGVLLFTGQDFVQLIEGAPQAVADLWARIRVDPRHHDLTVFLDERAQDPWFGDWRVGFPSDPIVTANIESWRQRAGPWDEAQREELRRQLAAIDAI